MNLEISTREREGILLLDLKGRITAGPDVGALRAAFEQAGSVPEPKAILNLQHVDYIDSTGLGAMVMCATLMSKAGGMAKLLNLNRRNMELLVLTKLDTIFEVFDDETDAVNSFFPGRDIRRFDILSFVQKLREE
ncbi:MAG: STAS domain-containing protein [Acidobacteriota bacterium]